MNDGPEQSDGIGDRHGAARQMAERAIAAQAAGDDEEADRLFAEASRIDPDAVSAALAQQAADPNDSATGADAAPQNDSELAAMSRTIEPNADAGQRTSITGAGSGADSQGI